MRTVKCGFILLSAVFSINAFSDYTESQYREALRIADQHVKKTHLMTQSSSALSIPLIQKIKGDFYRVGESWDVEVFQFLQNPNTPLGNTERKGRIARFHYEVVGVTPGEKPKVDLRVTQVAPLLDAKVKALEIEAEVGGQEIEQVKKYYLLQNSSQIVLVSPEGLRSPITPIELFPVDFPNVSTLDEAPFKGELTLPKPLKAHFDPAQSLHFDGDDFLGKPLDVVWQHGDPWPAYMRTSLGVSVLLRNGDLR
jgi:hypothetical protein